MPKPRDSHTSRTHPTDGTSRRWPAIVSLAALLSVSLVAGASAQLDAGEDTGANTPLTPRANETLAWIQVGGAEYGKDSYPTEPTPVESEFYTVAFDSETHGFAGGMKCKEPPSEDAIGDDLTTYLENCGVSGREPIIYEFVKTETEETWEPVLPPDGDGYVGAIAFMPDGRALAVGGTGEYPKREKNNPTTVANDIAGDARAWIYDDGFWAELHEPDMAEGMRGLTALAVSPRPGDCKGGLSDCALAGGYRQLWVWKNGGFKTGWDTGGAAERSAAADAPIDDPAGFRFRVRGIAFIEQAPGSTDPTTAIAVTSGCCADTAVGNTPSVLYFNGEALAVRDGTATAGPGEDASADRIAADSLYNLVLERSEINGISTAAAVAAPGGPPDAYPAGEPTSDVYTIPTAPSTTRQPRSMSLLPPKIAVSRMRMVSGAGIAKGNNFFIDWTVGALPTGQGLAYDVAGDNGALRPLEIGVLNCPGGPWKSPFVPPPDLQCEPYDAPDGYLEQIGADDFYRLPSYALHAFSFTDDTESVGWAVGERGALVRLGGIGTTAGAGVEPEPAKLGPATTAKVSGSDVYDGFRPLPTEGDTGPVPSLASNGTTKLDRPELVPAGSPNPTVPQSDSYPPEDVTSVVMSPDGSEGWAVGAGGVEYVNELPLTDPAPTVYHYNGTRWTRCDILGVGELLPPDPACESLSELFGHGGGVGGENVSLRHAVRVPTENDDDPSNDDEFEVFAIGTEWAPAGPTKMDTPLRYRDGRWSIDEVAFEAFGSGQLGSMLDVKSIAFTSPNDGWVVSGAAAQIKHWDGEKWWSCLNLEIRKEHCGDSQNLLPVQQPGGYFAVAGKRIYFAGNRDVGGGATHPAILYKDPDGSWTAEGGGYDPNCEVQEEGGCATPAGDNTNLAGRIFTMAVSPNLEHGWAIGKFGGAAGQTVNVPEATPDEAVGSRYYLLRLGEDGWSPYAVDDATRDYLANSELTLARRFKPVILDEDTGAAAIHSLDKGTFGPSVLMFDPARGPTGRWRVFQTPFHNTPIGDRESSGLTRAFAPDGRGGAWLVAKANRAFGDERPAVHFWHYTDEVPNQVFEEAPHPVRETITGGAPGPDGSFWVSTNSGFVYRYDRLTGWDRLRVPGWDPGRVVTRTSEANAIAVGADGEGLVVGKNGRIAQISAVGVKLDPAAGKRCGAPPCGSPRDLKAVAVSPGGAALAGGEGSSLLWRPPGGDFRTLDWGGSPNASITDISMPANDRAWLTNTAGQVYAGRIEDGEWKFFVENRTDELGLLSRDERAQPLRINGIEIDEDGEGYAVGARGLILERRGDGGWQRLKTAFNDTFRSVAVAPKGRDQGALIGGDMGLILTLEDGEFRVAREADLYDPLNYGISSGAAARVLDVAMLPGLEDGEVEAWAVQQGDRAPAAIFHYASDSENPLMRVGGRVDPIPDVPAPREGEISFAAFGRSECHVARNDMCGENHAGNLFHEVVASRVAKSVIARSKEDGGPDFAIFTGDVGRAAGTESNPSTGVNTPIEKSVVHRRWIELVANRFDDADVPLFGAVGRNDLDRTAVCPTATVCGVDAKQATGAGLTWGWRKAMAGMPPPWGAATDDARPAQANGYRFDSVGEAGGQEEPVVGQARTHYAIDLKRTKDGKTKPVARLIFLDNSMGTVSASDPNQNPIEAEAGQLGWLDRMLAGVDRERGQQPIVVMNTPTYSYAAGDPSTWAGDALPLEQRLMQGGAKMVVSGRLGWNGRSWATAPGVHHPCPDGAYIHDDNAPEPDQAPCEEQTSAVTDPATAAGDRLADALQGLGAPAPPGEDDTTPVPGEGEDPAGAAGLQGLLPMVVAASAGGTFGPAGNEGGAAGNGWWHGYTIVRMDASGDPRKTIVEQRPVFDWISITGNTHVLKPRQRLVLRGEGREPVGSDVAPRYDAINSYSITHRYDLVLADEGNPSVPRRDAQGDYVEVPSSVGSINRETGVVTAGSGRQERTYAVAILSVGDRTASWPVAFEPAKSFKPRPVPAPLRSVISPPARPAQVRPVPPPPVVLNQPAASTPPGAPPPPLPQINVPPINLPPPPQLPNLPSLPGATGTPAPPPPPAPPAPPGNAGGLPLTLQAPLTPISIVTTVIPPSPPPVNPAPPSGSAARKEARQRQAATAKSEEGGGDQEGAGDGQSSGESGASEMTRRDRTRPAPSYADGRRDDRRYSFTAVSHSEQASAWTRGALYGGMTMATALVLALGWGIARPTPKRRHPPRPAPETVRSVRTRTRN